jgi:hypothetical protein
MSIRARRALLCAFAALDSVQAASTSASAPDR